MNWSRLGKIKQDTIVLYSVGLDGIRLDWIMLD